MRHIDHELRAGGVGDLAKEPEVDLARIGRAAGDDERGPAFLGQPRHLVEVDPAVLAAHAVLHRVEPLAGEVGRCAVRQVPTGGERHAEHRVARLAERHEGRLVGLRAGMRLDVDMGRAEQPLRSLDGEPLRPVHPFAAAIVAPPRIALGIFVGQHRALRLQHGARDDVLGCDQLDLVALAHKLPADSGGEVRVGVGQRRAKEIGHEREAPESNPQPIPNPAPARHSGERAASRLQTYCEDRTMATREVGKTTGMRFESAAGLSERAKPPQMHNNNALVRLVVWTHSSP